MPELSTEGVKLSFGKHKGKLMTRVPVSYIRWMVNQDNIPMKEYAQAEFKRRGNTMPLVELSGHAIDNASLRVRKIWHETRDVDEGLWSWLQRMTLEAIKEGEEVRGGKIKYKGMKFVIEQGEEFPILKTIMR